MSTFNKSESDFQNFSITCSDVPESLLNKDAAKEYFQQFGRILRMRIRLKQKVCIIEYADEDSAHTAYNKSGEYNGEEFIVSWSKPKKAERKSRKKLLEDPNWSDDPDIKNELQAMSGSVSSYKMNNFRFKGADDNINRKKSTLPEKTSKLRLWKSEKLTKIKPTSTVSSVPSLPSVNTDMENELLKIIMSAALTSEEKYRILEARDKLIRSRTVKQSELARVTRTIGTCPDMCPEKERLMRETQHQVAVYELQSGTNQKNAMNHSIAVKQYSRSSADQEAPLAHELRPVNVLQLTMGYLLHRIMDLCETSDVNLSEWYHFVWDRTRGIRKDITQQELCCEKSVQLVEQCARFHVHCAARLVAEDLSVFDDKINTENLTKCLQTLKYMYHDLKVKKGVNCPNESEFRAYIVLLNLNDGNFMWEVQQLSRDIQQSPEIKFAISVYSALDKNNYVRFFKLVKSTTYLNACILLRYFNQVRYKALLTILKCYSARIPYTMYPLQDIYKNLAFEDMYNTVAFLEYHGLQVNHEGTNVFLDRTKFRHPDMPFSLERAINIVESKRGCSVGEIVCGSTLPEKLYEKHVPQNSFDNNGYLKLSELPKDFQEKYQKFLMQLGHVPLEKIQSNTDNTMSGKSIFSKQSEQTNTDQKPSSKIPFSFTSNVKSIFPVTKSQEVVENKQDFKFTLSSKSVPDSSKDITEIDGETNVFGGFKFNNFQDNRSKSPLTYPKNESVTPFWSSLQTNKDSNSEKSIFGDFKQNITQSTLFKPINTSLNNRVQEENKITFTKQSVIATTSVPPAFIPSTVQQSTSINHSNKFSFESSNIPKFQSKIPDHHTKEKHEEYLLEKERSKKEDLLKQLKEAEEQKLKQRQEAKRLEELKKQELQKQREKQEFQRNLEEQRRKIEIIEAIKIKSEVTIILNQLLDQVQELSIKNRLQEITNNIKTRKIITYVRKWRNITRISRKKRKNFFDNPVWISSRSVASEAKELFTPSQNITLHDMKRYKLGTIQELKSNHIKPIKSLDIYGLVWKTLFEKICFNKNKFLSLNLYWKIGFSIPDILEMPHGLQHLENMFTSALNWTITDYGVMSLKKMASNNGGSLSYCIKKLTKFEDNLQGLLFFNNSDQLSTLNIDRFKKVLDERLTKIAIPLVILIRNGDFTKETRISHELNLKKLLENNIISQYNIFYCNDYNFVDILQNCMKYLANNYDDYGTVLEMNELEKVLRNYLSEEMLCRLESSAVLNKRFAILLQEPNIIIQLYNQGLQHIFNILFDDLVYCLPNFPKEFTPFLQKGTIMLPCTYEYLPDFWNNESYVLKIKNIVKSLYLPQLETNWPPKNLKELEGILKNYCSKIFKNSNSNNIVLKILGILFKKINKSCTDTDINLISWLNIMQIIINEKLNTTSFFDNTYFFYTVVYNLEEINEFKKSPWWFKLDDIQKRIKMISYEEEIREPEIITEESEDEIDLDETLTKIRRLDNDKLKECQELNSLIFDLEQSMAIQKKIMTKFELTAKKALEE